MISRFPQPSINPPNTYLDTGQKWFFTLHIPMKEVPIHTSYDEFFQTDDRHSAHAFGNTGVHVLATVSLIAWIEQASGMLLKPFLDKHEISVGTIVSIKHRASAPIGIKIQAKSILVSQNKNKFLFSVQVMHEQRLLLEGTHGRVVCPQNLLSQPNTSIKSLEPTWKT
jgi:predicted thioesterase